MDGDPIPPAETAAFIAWARAHGGRGVLRSDAGALGAGVRGAGVEVAVMEAGVGGATDATQALENVAAVALTNVALDHVGVLGER